MARITINGVTVDPQAKGPALAAPPPRAKDASGSDYILIQTREPLTDQQRAKLESLGVVIHEYVPDDTYLAGFKGTDLRAIRALRFVTWADVYLREFKVPPALKPAGALAGAERSPSRKMRRVDIVLHEDADPDTVRDQIAAAARLNPDDIQ